MTRIRRIKSFDTIRAVAVAGVLLYHLNAGWAPYGYLGVVTFFVMAGYLSLHHLLERGSQPIKQQLISKGRKLYPPLITMLFVVSLVMIIFFPNFLGTYGSSMRSAILGVNNYQQLLSGDSYFQGQLYLKPLTHLWAISLELQFYLLFILLVNRFYDDRQAHVWQRGLLGVSLISIFIFAIKIRLNADPTPAYYGLESRLFSFSLGMLARQMTPVIQSFRYKRTLVFIGFGLAIGLYFKNFSSMTLQMAVYSLLISGLLMAAFWDHSFLKSVSELSPIRWFSHRSYYIYLWHYPVIAMGSRWLANVKLPLLVYILMMLVLSLGIAESFYRLQAKIGRQQLLQAGLILLSVVLLALPYQQLYDLRADESFKQLEQALTQDPSSQEPSLTGEPGPFDAQSIIRLKPSAVREDFQPTFISSFDELNQVSPEINYSFVDFLRYRDLPVTLIGDSIAYMAEIHFPSYLPNIYTSAEKSRLLEEVDQYYFDLKAKQQIRQVVILSFGSNAINETDEGLEKIWQDLDGKPMILVDLVMPYPVNEESRNAIIHQFAQTHDNVYLASWYDYAKTNPEFFEADYMHPNDLGARAFIHLITDQVIEIAKAMEAEGKLIIE